jgi:hypothetical protein
MEYVVYQCFETLGDPGRVVYGSREAAEDAARELVSELTGYVAAQELPEESDAPAVGLANEVQAWARARELSEDNAGTYGRTAGRHIARKAVRMAYLVDGEEIEWSEVEWSRDGAYPTSAVLDTPEPAATYEEWAEDGRLPNGVDIRAYYLITHDEANDMDCGAEPHWESRLDRIEIVYD